MPLAELSGAAQPGGPLSVESTLYVSPLPRRPIDPAILARLQETAAGAGAQG
jgi:hypothetical protein